MGARERPLLIAEAANPEAASVPLVGWSLATAIRQKTGAHIVTQLRNREAFLRAGLLEGTDFTAIDSEAVAAPMNRLANTLRMGHGRGWTTVMAFRSLSYPYFERLFWKAFGADIARGRYSVVHRITPLSPTVPSFVASKVRRAGVPFVLGPLNGGIPWPYGFDAERRREAEWLSYVRGAYKFLPGRATTLRAASAIIAGSRHTEGEFPDWARRKIVYIPENGIDPERFSAQSFATRSLPLRAAFVGRLVPYKGADMLLRAAAPILRDGRLVLDIVGDGPMMAELKALADEQKISGAVTFHGMIRHEDVQNILTASDLFTFPSIREFGGAVVIEAMSLGVVPVIVDYGGPGEHVTREIGFRIPIGSRDEIQAALRAQLDEICADPGQLSSMSERARVRIARKYTWERKAAQILQVYDWTDDPNSRRPDPFIEM